jgi:hypothetical protein
MLKYFTPTCTLRTVVCLPGLPIKHPVLADGASTYDDCMVLVLRDARSQVASNYIQHACYALYRNGELVLPRETAYYECILDNMPGACNAHQCNLLPAEPVVTLSDDYTAR